MRRSSCRCRATGATALPPEYLKAYTYFQTSRPSLTAATVLQEKSSEYDERERVMGVAKAKWASDCLIHALRQGLVRNLALPEVIHASNSPRPTESPDWRSPQALHARACHVDFRQSFRPLSALNSVSLQLSVWLRVANGQVAAFSTPPPLPPHIPLDHSVPRHDTMAGPRGLCLWELVPEW